LVTTHGFGRTSGAAFNGAEVFVDEVKVAEGAATAPTARMTPTSAARMSMADPAAAFAGEPETLKNLIIA
jgi:hypothetical protein